MWIDFISGNGGGGVTPSDVEQMIENKQNLYTATTLSDITNPKEGDVASITTTASSTTWVELTVSQFKNILENNLWGDYPNFKFSVDTSVQSEPWQLGVIYGDYELTWVIGYAENGVGTTPYWYDGGDYSVPNQTYDGEWDGSEITMTFPTPIDDNLVGMAYDTPTGLTILNQQNVTTTALTQYTYVNGQWVETGTGSGGEQFVELTKAQYEALTGYAEDTTYIITDAPSIDLNTLATTGQVETKADKANVSANTNRLFPRWNTQGIITGTTGSSVYERSLGINDASKTILQTTSSSFGNIYAPTSAGTAGQILQSNGSGAPVWSTFKMWYGTQTQYDAITTKDNNTIYFVTDD